MRRSRLPLCPMQNDRRRGHELERSGRPCGTFRAQPNRTRGHTSPKSPAGAAAFAHPCLPLWIRVYISSVIVEQIALNLRLSWLTQKGKFIGPEIRIIAFHVRIAFPTWRVRVVCSDSRFVRSAFSFAARSAQKARRVFQFAPRPSLCATAS